MACGIKCKYYVSMNWKMEKEGLCYIWLYSYFERVIVSDSVDVAATHVLCSVLTWSLEVTINFAQDGIVNSL